MFFAPASRFSVSWNHNVHKHFEFSSLSYLTTTVDGIYDPCAAHQQEVMKMLWLQF